MYQWTHGTAPPSLCALWRVSRALCARSKQPTLEAFAKWLRKLLVEAATVRFAVEDHEVLGAGPRAPAEIRNHEWPYTNGHTRASTLRASLRVLDHVLFADLALATYVLWLLRVRVRPPSVYSPTARRVVAVRRRRSTGPSPRRSLSSARQRRGS